MTGASTAVASARPGRSLDARPPADRSTRAPIESPLQDYLAALHARLRGMTDGAVADYIPELGRADPDWFGIAIATRDGHVYEVGDTRQPFTIQSVSKPLTYGLALEDNGEERLLAKIGVEPPGEAFNAISLRADSGVPLNPLINAGAITACGLLAGSGVEERTQRIVDTLSRYAGRALDIDERVYRSESATGFRNRAIGWMLRNFAILPDDPTSALETYFRQCSVLVTCRDLALIGATLANGGANPLTGTRAVAERYVDNVPSVMATCGMYDFSGEWLYRTGLPAKSGVSGGVLAVQPGHLGIAVFSPRLDAQGNSVRGVAACRELATDLGLHLFTVARQPAPVARVTTTGRHVTSKRRRSTAAAAHLHSVGHRMRLYRLQGTLAFASVEKVIRELIERSTATDCFIINLGVVQGVDPVAARLLSAAHARLSQSGKALLFADADTYWPLLVEAGVPREAFFADDDFALEHGEDLLLAGFAESAASTPVFPTQCQLLAGLAERDLALLQRWLRPRRYRAGQTIVTAGQASDELFIITRGTVMVSIPTQDGVTRLDVLGTGMAFGEVAFLDRSPRSANVTATEDVECLVLARDDFGRLDVEAPAAKIRLLENIALGLARSLRNADRELAALR